MQGKKSLHQKILYNVNLSDLVPDDNFYRKLDKILDFNFLYKRTKQYYGFEGQESIDPVVFFKIILIGYLNNINSDRKLIEKEVLDDADFYAETDYCRNGLWWVTSDCSDQKDEKRILWCSFFVR